VNLVALSQIGHRDCSRATSKAIFAMNAASIFRLVFPVIICSIYQDGAPRSNYRLVPNSR
jgi:hypothetical protein